MQLATYIHQKTYEQILYKIRRHKITLVPVVISFLALFAMPLIVFFMVNNFFPGLLERAYILFILKFAFTIYYLSIGLFAFTYWVNYYLDLLIITNDRLLHIDQDGLFARTISEVDLYKIQDITSTIDGFFPSLFDYGDLLIQTAAEMEKFKIRAIPHTETLRQKILDLAEADRKYHQKSETI